MQIPQDISEKILREIQKAKTILIISHRNPDADTIGSNLALRELFENKGKRVISACVDPLPPGLEYLKNAENYVQEFDQQEIDLIFCVDAGSTGQAAFLQKYPDLFSSNIPVINIDHHASNDNYGNINLVFGEAASTTLVLYYLWETWGEKITENTATCLLFGLYYDTGSFMHSNTTDEVYEIAGDLIKNGAKLEQIIKSLFKQHTIPQLKLWGKIFSEMQMNSKNIVVAGVTQEDFTNNNATSNDLSGAINYLNMAKGNSFVTLLSEDNKGNIRGSFRTRSDEINLAEIAEMLGGGGHKKACGFTINGKLKKEKKWVLKME